MEFEEDSLGVRFGFDGSQLGGNDIQGLNDLSALLLSDNEVSGILLSGFSQDLLLFGQDFELAFLVLDLTNEGVDLTGQLVDLGGGFSHFIGSEVDSSVVAGDFSGAVNLVSSVFHVRLLLLRDEVLTEVLKHLCDVGKGGLVFHLKGDGVQEFLSHLVLLDLFQVSENGGIRVGGLVHEYGLAHS